MSKNELRNSNTETPIDKSNTMPNHIQFLSFVIPLTTITYYTLLYFTSSLLYRLERLVDLKAEISGAISQLANVDEQLLLRFRYINNYGWEKIAVLMSVSMRTVHRIHASALRDFQPPA